MSTPDPPCLSGNSRADSAAAGSSGDVSHITAVLDEYAHLRGTGRQPDRAEFLAHHAPIASELLDYLDGLDLVLSAQNDLLAMADPEPAWNEALMPSMRLGDYLIVREVGRGGMGVVYEAEQLPLGRRVALKVLPSAASLDSRQRQRFQLEAQAVALLQHEHIVPVYGVGCDQGVHYYAMQFIDGRSLAEVIRDLRANVGAEPADLLDGRGVPSESSPSDDDALEIPSEHHGAARSSDANPDDAGGADWDGSAAPPRRDAAPRSHLRSPGLAPSTATARTPDFYRTVAWYGVQAAEALQHAHDAGVIHRDIKPSNLIVDARGRLWVTDFGLARLPQDDPSLTRTGDLVGTLRYMSPEQVRGARHEIDAGTDIYALGLTLYELMTLRPAFVAADREELLRRILQDEPVAPRRINPSIPRDLETIILKAIAKELPARYGSSRELADDLDRFLDDQPIQARRPNLLERTSRWSRRHRPVVLTAVVVLVLSLSVSTVLLWQAKRRTDEALASLREAKLKADSALQMRRRALNDERIAYEEAFEVIERITGHLVDGPGVFELRRGSEAERIYRPVINYYDRIARMFESDPRVREVAAKASRRAGFFRAVLGEPAAREGYRRAIRIDEEIASQFPDQISVRTALIETLREYSVLLSREGDREGAEASTRRALQVAAGLIGNEEAALPWFRNELIAPFNSLAWDLVASPPQQTSDTALAIRLARQAVAWDSHRAAAWTTLGVALCRAGDWEDAASALEESLALSDGGAPRDWFFLAIARHRLGDPRQAGRWYDRAVGWMERNRTEAQNPELCRFRAEAAKVLGRAPADTPKV